MARARNIKPGFFDDDRLAELPALARLLWISLWTIADREGRLEDRPARIKAKCLPFDRCDAAGLLVKLNEAGFIKRYAVNGHRYICIPNFSKHQNPHVKEPKSTIPPPDEPSAKPVPAEKKPEPAGRIPDSGFPLTDSGFPPATSAPTQPAALHSIQPRKPDGDKSPNSKGENPLATGQWWKSNDGIEAQARSVGITAKPGELHRELKDRVFAELEKRKRQAA